MDHHTDTPLVLKRRIHLTRSLGEGSMGQVFDGFASDLGQYLAVKVLRPEHANDSEIQARFEEETALLGLIDHPGSPAIYGKGKNIDGLPFYAMKKVEGRTLADLLAERGAEVRNAPWRQRLIAILLDACETVAYAHETGIVHRDIKPRNILIDRHRSVYVIDWGIAKRLGSQSSSSDSSHTTPGKVMGSPGYMAPEQAEGRADSVGPQADVFALGAVLYEILTGRRPFGSSGGRDEILASVHREATPPHHGNWTLPRSISRICMKALHKDPAQRYSDARGLATDLRAFLEGRMNLIERVRDFARHHPLQMAAAVLLALSIATLVFGTTAQFWTDQRMAAKAMARVSELDAELVKIASEAETARSGLESPDTDAKKRGELKRELDRLNARWIVTEFEALRLLASVTELRVVKVESEIHPLARERLLTMVKSLIEREQPALANALIQTVLTRYHAGSNALGLRSHDVAQLKQLAGEANRHVIAPNK